MGQDFNQVPDLAEPPMLILDRLSWTTGKASIPEIFTADGAALPSAQIEYGRLPEDLAALAPDADLIINTTSLGLARKDSTPGPGADAPDTAQGPGH